MGKLRSTGITYITIIIVLMIVLFAAASIITGETSNTTTDQDYEQILNDVLDDISTYIQIKDKKGKFYEIDNELKITKIALLISPLISNDIDLSSLSLQIDNGEFVNIQYYSNSAVEIGKNTVFEHPVWNDLNGSNFSFISINDRDDSLVNYNIFNKNSDIAYLILELPSYCTMQKYDEIKIILFPDTGIKKTITLEAPMPMNRVITFE